VTEVVGWAYPQGATLVQFRKPGESSDEGDILHDLLHNGKIVGVLEANGG
jgi:hypothetical protein